MSSARWKEAFQSAVTESDPTRLSERVDQARTAIMERVDELLEDDDRQHEHDEILRAINHLSRLTQQK